MIADCAFPLTDRFPTLASVARARFGRYPSPLQQLSVSRESDALWIKRDDLNADGHGGNKVRALEFLLGAHKHGRAIVTVGGVGSTHVLSTALWGKHLASPTIAATWPHELAPISRRVSEELLVQCAEVHPKTSVPSAFASAALVRRRIGGQWIPFGGTSPLGMLGHVNAALELALQVERGDLPAPAEVVVAHGTGGTAAGLALGFAIAGLPTKVVAVRAGPRHGAERARLLWLASRTATLMQRHGALIDSRSWRRLAVELWHGAYAGAYGRPLPAAEESAARIGANIGATLDATYSAKAFYAALERRDRRGPMLVWHTFDGRWLAGKDSRAPSLR